MNENICRGKTKEKDFQRLKAPRPSPKAHGEEKMRECETRHKFMSRQKNKKIVYRLMIKIFPRNK